MNKYNSTKSQTHIPDGEREEIDYMAGKTAGFWSMDKITLGSLELEDHRFMETVSYGCNKIKNI